MMSVALSCSIVVGQDNRAQTDALLPPRVGLLPVPLPALDSLEPSVREQISAVQEDFRRLGNAQEADLAAAYGLLGQIYQAYELATPAEAAYLNAIRLAPQDGRWVHLLGYLYLKSGRLREAALYFETVAAQHSDATPALCYLGDIYLQMGEGTKSREYFQKALAVDAATTAALAGLGEVTLAEKKYAEAVDYLEAALKQVPDASRLHYLLGMAYRGQGDLEKARAHLALQGKVGVRPVDPLVDALPTMLQGATAHTLRGEMAFQAGRYEEALSSFQRAVEAAPDSAGAHVNLGATLRQLGRVDESSKELEKALALEPDNRSAHFNLGVIEASQGHAEKALEHFQAVISSNPEDLSARRMAAGILASLGRLQEALVQADAIFSVQPSEDHLMMLVNIQVGLKHYRDALDNLQAAYKNHPDVDRVRFALARLLAASPEVDLRDGAKALEIARGLYAEKRTLDNGQLVAAALAEKGDCQEAGSWITRMISIAIGAGDTDRARQMQTDLARYTQGPPCRPPGRAD